jgi:hypothetical protein
MPAVGARGKQAKRQNGKHGHKRAKFDPAPSAFDEEDSDFEELPTRTRTSSRRTGIGSGGGRNGSAPEHSSNSGVQVVDLLSSGSEAERTTVDEEVVVVTQQRAAGRRQKSATANSSGGYGGRRKSWVVDDSSSDDDATQASGVSVQLPVSTRAGSARSGAQGGAQGGGGQAAALLAVRGHSDTALSMGQGRISAAPLCSVAAVATQARALGKRDSTFSSLHSVGKLLKAKLGRCFETCAMLV